MYTRKKTREQAWSVGSWAETVQEVRLRALRSLLTPDRHLGSIYEVGHHGTLQMEPTAMRAEHQDTHGHKKL